MDSSESAPVRCEVIGRRQSSDLSTLAFILQCEASGRPWRVYRTVKDFHKLHTDLSHDFRLLPDFTLQTITTYELEQLEYLQRKLQSYLEALLSRRDIVATDTLRGWLELAETLQPLKPVLLSDFQVHPKFTATCLFQQLADSVLIVGLADLGASSAFNIWNLLEAGPKGGYALVPMTSTGLEGLIANFESVEEVMACAMLKHGELFLGLRSGEVVWTHLVNMQEGGKWKSDIVDQLKVHGGNILSMAVLESQDLVFSVSTDNCLRVFGPRHGKLEILGGGSLRNRLQEVKLTLVTVEPTENLIYLGTDSNRMLVYRLEECKAVYVTTLVTRDNGPINCIVHADKFLLVGEGNELQALNHSRQPTGVFALPDDPESQITAVAISGQRLVTGYSTGLLALWDINTYQLLSAFHSGTTKVVALLTAFSEGLLMSLTEDGKIKTWRLCEY